MIRTLTSVTKQTISEIAEEMRIRQTGECFILFALGSQYDHLILQTLNRCGVFCLLADPATFTAANVKKINPLGIILSGGPASVVDAPPRFDNTIFDLGIPVLGICLGFQLWAKHIGATVTHADHREFGVHRFDVAKIINPWDDDQLFWEIPENGDHFDVLESHGDCVKPHDSFTILGSTENTPVAAARHNHLYGVQFHPETTETGYGDHIFERFCFSICGAKDHFPAPNVAEAKIKELREQIGDKKVLLAFSGGCDSWTTARLLGKALGEDTDQICAVYIKGIDRPDDEAYILKHAGNLPWLNLRIIDATDRFLAALEGIETMAEKREAMCKVYKQVLEEAAKEFGATFIAQGTLYTDITESGGGLSNGAVIKHHHNYGLDFDYVELTPLSDQVKDTGRDIGKSIGIPDELLYRHPFPGPGLIIRIEGLITLEKLAIARQADQIFIEEIRRHGFYDKVWQAGVIITDSMVTCTKGDDAVLGRAVVLRAVTSVDGHTARWFEFPPEFLRRVSTRLSNEIREIGRVLYDISDKPPSTIEWG